MSVKKLFVISHPRSGLHLFAKMLNLELYVDFVRMDCDNFLINKIKDNEHRLLFTHKSPCMMDNSTVQYIIKNTKPILITRDAKDSLTSYAILMSNGKNHIDFCKLLHKPFKVHKDLIDYSAKFLNWMQYKKDILILNYEDLLNNYEEQKIRIEEYTGFSVCKKLPDLKNVEMSRKGIIGDYKNYLSQELINEINQRVYENNTK